MISSVASKCQDFKVGMAVFQPFYEMKLKASKSWPFEASEDIMTKFKSQAMSLELNVEKLVGVATGNPPSFRPSGTQKFYFINRPPMPNILTPSVISVIAVIEGPL